MAGYPWLRQDQMTVTSRRFARGRSRVRQLGGVRWWLVLCLGLLALLALAGWRAYGWLAATGDLPVRGSAEPALDLFEIERGSSITGAIGALRSQQRLDAPAWRTAAYLRVFAQSSNIQAGEYLLAGRTLREELARWRSGAVFQRQVTLLPGWTLREIMAELWSAPALERTLEDLPTAADLPGVATDAARLEGLFYPDTYQYSASASDADILLRAYARQRDILAEEWSNRSPDLPYGSPYDALTMASIVEKETGQAEDRDEVAAVFTTRLRIGMMLQTDPTVIYGVGAEFDGNLTRKHLRTDTPYNTYTRGGLPPTPIAAASRESLHAALHPADVDYLYFVARGDGTTKFSRTLAEHNRAVDQFQRRRSR